jgi:hypothetical protein
MSKEVNNAEHEDMNIRPPLPNYRAGGATARIISAGSLFQEAAPL